MGKSLKCSDIGMDCEFETRGATEDEILQAAGHHAQSVHGMEVSDELVEAVRGAIKDE